VALERPPMGPVYSAGSVPRYKDGNARSSKRLVYEEHEEQARLISSADVRLTY
jgi:hypothetical protein